MGYETCGKSDEPEQLKDKSTYKPDRVVTIVIVRLTVPIVGGTGAYLLGTGLSFDRPAVNAACCLIIHFLIVFLVHVEPQANPAYYGQDSHDEDCKEYHKLEGRTPRHRSFLTCKQRSERHKLLPLLGPSVTLPSRPSKKRPDVPCAECYVAFSGQQCKRGEAVGMASRINASP